MTFLGPDHLLAVLTIAVIGTICIYEGRRTKTWPRAFLAFICLSIYPINQAALCTVDYPIPLNNIVPAQLCDVAALTAGFGILTRNPLLCELTYCWGLAGTLQGLITPNLPFDFPHAIYFSFFIQHGVIVIVALFLPLAMGWRPRSGIVPRILLWNQAYFFIAFTLNMILETNFGFLARKPEAATPLDLLGPWPVYLFWIQILAAVLMILLLLPFSKSVNIWRPE